MLQLVSETPGSRVKEERPRRQDVEAKKHRQLLSCRSRAGVNAAVQELQQQSISVFGASGAYCNLI